MKKLLILLFVIGIFASAPANAQIKTVSHQDSVIYKIMTNYQVFGLAYAVVKDGQVCAIGEYGYRDIYGNPLSENHDDIFMIASVSKSFTATAIMQLVDAGKINLDEDAGKYLPFKLRNPNFPKTKITVRMLLNHTSSIKDGKGVNENLKALDPDRDTVWTKHYFDFEPGTEFKYSNLAYNILGAVVEKASGERFDKYIRNHIMEPLGLSASFNRADLDSNKFVPNCRYNKKTRTVTSKFNIKAQKTHDGEYEMGYDGSKWGASYAMMINVQDLARYMRMHMNHGELDGVRILSEKSSIEMQTGTVWGKESETVMRKYGLGLSQYDADSWFPGKTCVGHGGRLSSGVLTTMYFNPEEQWGIVTLTNGADETRGDHKHPLVQALYDLFIADCPEE